MPHFTCFVGIGLQRAARLVPFPQLQRTAYVVGDKIPVSSKRTDTRSRRLFLILSLEGHHTLHGSPFLETRVLSLGCSAKPPTRDLPSWKDEIVLFHFGGEFHILRSDFLVKLTSTHLPCSDDRLHIYLSAAALADACESQHLGVSLNLHS